MTCPSCGTALADGARFCENCGAQVGADAPAPLTPPAQVEDHPLGDAPISAPTRRPHDALPDPLPDPGRRPCPNCGGEVGPDLYCMSCGTKAPSERDHFRESPASWVGGVCDKGVGKSRNEDAMALLAGTEPGSRAVLVVLDGVSNSIDSDVASLAGARAAREVLRMPLPSGMGTPDSRAAAITKVFNDAAAAANTAIIAVTDPDSPNPASATFSAAVLEGSRLHYANIGDSRSYWLPDDEPGVQLSVDDSIAQAQIAAGMPRKEAETGPQAHAITKWLGRDAEDIVPMTGAIDVSGDGWVLVCSDGLWNYASEPEALKEQIAKAGTGDPTALAAKLVDFANSCGGVDNITASLARVGSMPEPVEPPPPPAAADVPPPPEAPAPPGPAAPTASPVPPPPPPVGQNAPDTPPTAGPAAGEGAPTDG